MTVTIDRPSGSTTARAGRRLRSVRLGELALLPIIAAALVVGSQVSPAFLTRANLLDILQQSSVLALVVVAEALILIVGKIDLSLESIVGLAPMLAAYLMVDKVSGGAGIGLPPVLGLLVALLVGVTVGLANGLLVVKLHLNEFISTLAVLILLRGLTLGLTSGKTVFDLPQSFLYLGNAAWIGVPVAVWLAAAVFLLVGAFMRYHRTGRAIYAIGGNADAARAAGIRVERIIWGVYAFAGLLAAIAGVVLTGRIASVTSNQGQNLIFTVFAASVIGGISLDGGRGRIVGALTGVVLLGVITNILVLSQIQSFWIDAAFGLIILVALIVSKVTVRAR